MTALGRLKGENYDAHAARLKKQRREREWLAGGREAKEAAANEARQQALLATQKLLTLSLSPDGLAYSYVEKNGAEPIEGLFPSFEKLPRHPERPDDTRRYYCDREPFLSLGVGGFNPLDSEDPQAALSMALVWLSERIIKLRAPVIRIAGPAKICEACKVDEIKPFTQYSGLYQLVIVEVLKVND